MIRTKQFWVYILRCADDTLYTGYTVDIGARIMLHTAGKGAKYTRGRGPFELVYLQEMGTKSSAMKVEYRIKQLTRRQKEELIEAQEMVTLEAFRAQ